MLASSFASPRHPEFVPHILSQQTFRRVLVDVFLSIQVLFLRCLPENKTSPRKRPPLPKGNINNHSGSPSQYSLPVCLRILKYRSAEHLKQQSRFLKRVESFRTKSLFQESRNPTFVQLMKCLLLKKMSITHPNNLG